MYEYYSDVHDCEEPHFISLREIVLARKQPRKMFVQHNTEIQEGRVLRVILLWRVVQTRDCQMTNQSKICTRSLNVTLRSVSTRTLC